MNGAPSRIRTYDLSLRRGLRYPAVPWGRNQIRCVAYDIQKQAYRKALYALLKHLVHYVANLHTRGKVWLLNSQLRFVFVNTSHS